MPTPKKVQEVEEITDLLKAAQLTILTDYRGLTVADLQGLRSQLRPADARIRVVKNSLAAIAADNVGLGDLRSSLTGPTAIVTAGSDPVAPSKVISDFARASRILQIKMAVLDRKSGESAAARSLAGARRRRNPVSAGRPGRRAFRHDPTAGLRAAGAIRSVGGRGAACRIVASSGTDSLV
jgi:large subunit ribosomal protein L10